MSASVEATIYHHPECSTSRKVLALIRSAGIEPDIIEYVKMPPTRATLMDLISRARLAPRDLLREKEALYAQLGLKSTSLTGDQLVDAMLAHPVLMNRPLVVTPWGVKLCRPAETVWDILPQGRTR